MAFNSGFAADSGVENFYNTSVDFGKLTGSAAVLGAMEKLKAIEREKGTFNAIMGADAEAKMKEYYRQGQQAMHDAKTFNSYLDSGAQLLSGGVKAFGNAGGFDNLFGGGDTSLDGYKYGDYGNVVGEDDSGDMVSDYIGNNGGWSVNPGEMPYGHYPWER